MREGREKAEKVKWASGESLGGPPKLARSRCFAHRPAPSRDRSIVEGRGARPPDPPTSNTRTSPATGDGRAGRETARTVWDPLNHHPQPITPYLPSHLRLPSSPITMSKNGTSSAPVTTFPTNLPRASESPNAAGHDLPPNGESPAGDGASSLACALGLAVSASNEA